MVHQGDEHTLGVVKEFSTEMAGIGRVVMGHLKENQSIATDPVLQTKFHETWNAIGVSLVDRISREEKILYPLYDDR